MTPWSRILRPFEQTGAFNALINLHGFVDDRTFLTKSGDLGVVIAVEGVDDKCLDADQRDAVARRFEAALRVFDDHTRLLQYVIKQPRLPGRTEAGSRTSGRAPARGPANRSLARLCGTRGST